MKHTSPISMYVPARNAAATLSACVDSIRAQTRPPDELIILADPRSSDATVEVARTTGARVVIQTGSTLGAARNQAVNAAAHRWVASCDSDVILEPEWLAALAARRGDGAAGIGGRTNERVRTPFDAWRGLHMPHHWGDHPFRNPFMLVSEVLFDREALAAVKGYREDLNYYEDSDLCQRLRASGFTLEYNPAAVATHQRCDTLRSLLDLRWKYSEYRQSHLLGDRDGLLQKLPVNREYAINTLSRSLTRGYPELAYISFALFFHHALLDAGRVLSKEESVCGPGTQERILGALARAVGEMDAELAGWLLGDLRIAPTASAVDRAWTGCIESLATGAEAFCEEIGPGTLELIRRSAAVVHGCAPADGIATPQVSIRELEDRLEQMRPVQVVDSAFCDAVRRCWPDSGEIRLLGWQTPEETSAARTASGSAPDTAVAVIPHLQARISPCTAFAELAPEIQRLVTCYRPPERFVRGLEVVSASDLASAAAQAGWCIDRFDTLVGHTRLMLSRSASVAAAPRVPLEAACGGC